MTASDGATGDFFGTSVALSVDTALVGAPADDTGSGSDAGSAYVFVRSGTIWTQQAHLIAGDGAASDQFGTSLALSGETALVGANLDDTTAGTNAGSAYVFVRSGTLWTEEVQLIAADGAANDQFGFSAALSGETVLVGASLDDTVAGSDAGSAYVFVRSGTSWSEQAKLTASDGAAVDRFGYSVALNGDTVLVGARQNDTTGGLDAGSAYVFQRSGTVWSQQAQLAAGDPGSGDSFGTSVALSGNTAVVGVNFDDTTAGTNAGSAYVFLRTGVVWSQQAKLTADGAEAGDSFGNSVSLSGNTALVGAYGDDTAAGGGVGCAYVLVRSGSTWSQQAKLTVTDGSPGDEFGCSVALNENTAVVGAQRDNTGGGTDAGSAYVFQRSGTVWSQEAQLTAADGAAGDFFGSSVALSGQTALVGARFDDTVAGSDAGSAYVFVRSGSVWSQEAQLTSENGGLGDEFGFAVALSGDTALVGAHLADTGDGADVGSAPIFVRNGTTWTQQATLTAAVASAGDQFGFSVALSGTTALVGAYRSDTLRRDGGSAHVFVRNGTAWSLQAELTAVTEANFFGWSVAIDGDKVLVGAPFETSTFGDATGSAYVFVRSGTVWNRQVKLTAGADSSSNDQFGTSVALSGGTALVGCHLNDVDGFDAGNAYVFILGELPNITSQPNSRTVIPGVSVTFAVTASGYGPLLYQWRKDGSLMAGANGTSFTIPSAQVDDQGSYDVVISNLGGVLTSAPAVLKVNDLSQFTQSFPGSPPEVGGFLVVNLEPNDLLGTGWRFVGEQQWRVPGVPAGGLATGNREIEFRPVAGFLHPLREPVSIASGAAATVVEREYFQGGGVTTASLSVTLLPVSLGAAAQWRLLGEGDAAWRASGASLGGLAAGVYFVECKDVAGFTTPRPLSVTIGSGEAKTATATYFLADAEVGTQPGVVGFDAVTSATANPFTYVGQLRSDSGAGTGFVVRQRVVATAAHVVFDDGTLSAATGVQWVFQRERGTYEPVPQIPRGSYILSGYSAQRIADATPGTSSVAAQNLDVASVWFFEQDAGRGGSGGYLASDSTDNEWLISPRLKTIVGYPLDGISAANQGRIHATPPINATFGHANARVYLTDDITSRGGNSGGPVCVQYDDGRYFPAAIYLGGTTQTRVRAIDSDVITLFDSAEESSTTGQNSTNGGSTQTNNSLGSTPSGTLTVTIEPQAARDAGAGWRIGSGAFLTSGQSKPYLSAGDYTVTFKSIEGFQTPATRSVTVEAGKTVRIAITYNLPSAPSAVAVPTYTGLIIGTEGVAGQVVAGITKSKRLTLKLRIGSESLMITGVFDASGTFSGSIPRRGKTSALVTLAFDPDLVAQLSGEITLDGISYDLSAGKSLFQTKSPTSLAGKYTFVLPRDPGFSDPTTRPFGNGYALGSVSSRGAVSVAGVLGDGAAFAFSAPLFADATCPVYVQPYAKQGLLAGTLVFHDATTPDIASADGTLLWQKPATTKGLYKSGFTGSIAALGSRWTPPAKNTAALDITNWNFAIGNGVLVSPLAATVTLSPANLFTLTGAVGTKLTLAPKTGLLSGSFPGASGKPVKFNGALLQSQRIGRGVFVLPDKTGPVTLDPPP